MFLFVYTILNFGEVTKGNLTVKKNREGQTLQIGVRAILLALSFPVKKVKKGTLLTICLLLKEFFV